MEMGVRRYSVQGPRSYERGYLESQNVNPANLNPAKKTRLWRAAFLKGKT